MLLVDPSGLTSAAALGTFIHQHIRGMYPNQAGLLPNAALPGILVDLMPDIADWMVKQVIEVKPASMYGLTGWSQLDLYINVLNSIGTEIPFIGTGWHPGLWSPLPGAYVEPRTATHYVIIGNAAGVLFYYVPPRRPPQRVWERIKVRVREVIRDTGSVTEDVARRTAAEFDQVVLNDSVTSGAATAFAVAALTGAMIVGMVSMMGSLSLAF